MAASTPARKKKTGSRPPAGCSRVIALTAVLLHLGLVLQRHSQRQVVVAVQLGLELLGLVRLHGGALLDQLRAPRVPSLAKVLLVALPKESTSNDMEREHSIRLWLGSLQLTGLSLKWN